ncbi:MAG: hypothetical protein L6Q49_04400 [Anaerolineales bacterium]|nr:MAG: hypothetical protein EDM79_08205 [Chloroflexota bacterium]MCK6582323.1 hypothetical protein [Anaerolineales bacterium]
MRELAPDEKISTVIIYTPAMLVRGDLIVRENMRVSIWLRTQGVPNFIHLLKAHVIQLAGSPSKTYAKEEIFIPTSEIIGFHLAPPARDPVDYESSEMNRRMQPVMVLAGSFEMKGLLRVSTATDMAASIDVMNTTWLSLYDTEITNPYVPQLNIAVPMLLVRPNKVTIGLL